MSILTPEQAQSTLLRLQPQLAPIVYEVVRQLVGLFDASGQTTVANVLARCYVDKSAAAATKAFERLRDGVNEASQTLGDSIRLEVDSRKSLGDARAVYFRGELAVMVHAVADELADLPRIGKLLEQKGVWLGPHRPKAYPGVMLSSTFRDLVTHRAQLLKLLPRYELMPVAMEYTGAVICGDVVDSSLQMVRDAAGYICIIGYRYGQIPECKQRNPERFSLTELEFREAQRLNRPIALLIMGDKHSVPKVAVDADATDRACLKRFIEHAKCARVASTVHRVYAEFNSIKAFVSECQTLLPKFNVLLQVESNPANLEQIAPVQFDVITTDFDASDLRQTKFLIENQGRRVGLNADQLNASAPAPDAVNAFEQLTRWVQDPAAPAHFALLGEYGMGKTVLCQRLCEYLTEQRAAGLALPRPLYFDLRRMPARNDERVPTLEDTLEGCVTYGWLSAPGTTKPSVDRLKRWVTDGALVVFDGLDEVLVHLSAANGQQYTSQLLRLLDLPRNDKQSAPKMLLSCRSHFFKSLSEQRALLMERGRSKLDAQQFEALLLLPFTDAQVEDYLKSALPDLDSAQAMATIRAVHNVSELAARPYLLKEVARLLPRLEQWRMEGRKVQGVTVYREMVREWLLRDQGKHQIAPEHKLLVARDLAAELWARSSRMIDASALSSWYFRWRQRQSDTQLRYSDIHPDKLDEDLRNSQFLVREDAKDEKHSGFRFAHSSMQEYFLAEYLLQAVRDNAPERWAINLPSVETLVFFGQLLTEHADENLLSTLSRWRAPYQKQVSELYLHYALMAFERGWLQPSLHGLDMRGAKLRRMKFGQKPQAGQPRLALEQARFDGAALSDCQFRSVRLQGAQFVGADLSGASFIDCAIKGASFERADLSGTIFRRCVGVVSTDGARLHRTQWLQMEGAPANSSTDSVLLAPNKNPTPNAALTASYGHSNIVWACQLSADGNKTISAGYDNTLRLWDNKSGETLRIFHGHSSLVTDCQFSPDGRNILSASGDRTLRLWDINSGKTLRVFQGHSEWVTACQISPDGRKILSASYDQTLRLWDINSGKTLRVFQGHSHGVRACQLTPDGSKVLSASLDHTLRLWDINSGETLRVFQGHSIFVSACDLAPDGRTALSASYDGTLRLWDISNGETLRMLQGHSSVVVACQFAPDGRTAFSAGNDGTLRLWDIHSGETIVFQVPHIISDCQLARDGRTVLFGSGDGSLRFFDITSGEMLRVFQGYSKSVTDCQLTMDGRIALAANTDHTLRLWDINSGKTLRELQGHSNSVTACQLAPDSRTALSASADLTLRLWDINSGETQRVFNGHSKRVTDCQLATDGRKMLSSSADHTLRLWDTSTGETLRVFQGHSNMVTACQLAVDGSKALSASLDRTLRLWDLSTGETLRVFQGHSGMVTACQFLPDGSKALSASEDHTLRLWDTASGETLRVFQGHSNHVKTCQVTPDGSKALSASDDNTLRLWNINSGETLRIFQGHTSPVTAGQLSADGSKVLSASEDGTLRLWDVATGETLRVYLATDSGTAYFDPRPIRDENDTTPRLIHATGEIWRHLAWQVPTADGGWDRVPLETFGDVVQD